MNNIRLTTPRLTLRPWQREDARDLYEAASDPCIGPACGWPVHRSLEESRRSIASALSGPECYAICRREENRAIGCIELKLKGRTDMTDREDECEMGFWIARPCWGQGLMPEAVREMLRHAFEDLHMSRVWIGYWEGNDKSRRVQEKCGFRFHHRSEDVDVPLMHEKRTGYVSSMTRDQWEWDRMALAARAVQGSRKISDYVEAGGVAAAVMSSSGNIYTGVCIDTCSTLGICAERNAIFSMITRGEQDIKKVLAIMPNGQSGAPCGACRELMVQLMPGTYPKIQIMMDMASERVLTMGDLTPEWWIRPEDS